MVGKKRRGTSDSACARSSVYIVLACPSSYSVGSEKQLFRSVDNCVYFAVSVLDHTRHLYTVLDRTTIQLLGDNPRVNRKMAAHCEE